MKQTRSLSEFSCLSEYSRLYHICFLIAAALLLLTKINKTSIDKSNKLAKRPANTLISLGIRVFAVHAMEN